MKVVFDHQIFQQQRTGGISKSFCEFIPFLKENGVDWNLSVVQSDNLYLSRILPPGSFSPVRRDYSHVPALFSSRKLGAYWFTLLDRLRIRRTAESLNKSLSVKTLEKGDFDVFHPTYFHPYFLEHLKGKPFVLTVHDLIPERFPEYFRAGDIQITGRKALLDKAQAIVAVSNNTKKDLMELYGVPAGKIAVIYHGAPRQDSPAGEPLVDAPYFLFVGARGFYKNFASFAQAFSAFSKEHPEVKVVCTGRPLSQGEEDLLASLSIRDKVVPMQVSEEDLPGLYRHAIALVYPSRYEGFGMPLLEAFSFRCPVLTSPWSSLPEVGGDVALYLREDFSDFSDQLTHLYTMAPSQREELIQAGTERAAAFSWEKTAAQYADIYQSLL